MCHADKLMLNLRKVEVEKVDTGVQFTDEADVIINARGGLNEYVWPQIEDYGLSKAWSSTQPTGMTRLSPPLHFFQPRSLFF